MAIAKLTVVTVLSLSLTRSADQCRLYLIDYSDDDTVTVLADEVVTVAAVALAIAGPYKYYDRMLRLSHPVLELNKN